MTVKLYNLENEVVGETDLLTSVFDVVWKPALVHQALVAFMANQRRPWAHAKTRAEVRGGGRKPWRQKGTGRARHGSIRSPLWRGGGKAHGPLKERDYSQKINRKMKRLALTSALSKKLKDGEVKVFETLEVSAPKTKILAETLKKIIVRKKGVKKFDVLLVAGSRGATARASRNLVKVQFSRPQDLNIYDVLNHKHIFIDKESVSAVGRQFELAKK